MKKQLFKFSNSLSFNNTSGFTLIELLTVVAIIGIIVGIAMIQLAGYTQGGYDARAKSDLRNAASSEEAYFVEANTYLACSNTADCENTLPEFKASPGTNLEIAILGNNRFCWDCDQCTRYSLVWSLIGTRQVGCSSF
ncbi:MAG: prepilin-type N-terminal cleavage/methylation domain-containing protein [Bdellovibrionota bacterium]